MCLCELPEGVSWTVDYFLERTQYLCVEASKQLRVKSQLVETAVYELIDMLCGDYRNKLDQLLRNQSRAASSREMKRPDPESSKSPDQRPSEFTKQSID